MNKKRLITFSANPHFLEGLKLEFDAPSKENIEITACLFSTAYNRNRGYFQVSKLMQWENKLERIMHNFNHDLVLSGGQYFGNTTKLTKMWMTMNGDDLEIWATLVSSDPNFIARKDEITAPSIELMVHPDDILSDEKGDYFIDFDFVGIGWLLGIPAGSGDARVTSIREFSSDLKQEKIYNTTNQTTNTDMTIEEIQPILDEQKTALTESFKAEMESIKTEFAAQSELQLKQFSEIVGQYQSSSDSVYEYTNENGDKFRCTDKSMYASMTELLEKGSEINESSELGIMMRAKGYSITKVADELDEAAAAVAKAEEVANKLKSFRSEEELEGQNPASNPADTKASFSDLLKSKVRNNFK